MKYKLLLATLSLATADSNKRHERKIPLERGIDPALLGKYVPDADGMWSCLSDPSIKIPIEWVNDDFCDCPDGSDEPGTAACPNGKFFCQNSGFEPGYISARLVDDGMCDSEQCCDGSDEISGKCPNRCAEVAQTRAAERLAIQERREKGLAARRVLVERAQAARVEVEHRRESLEQELKLKRAEADSARQTLEQAKEEAAKLSERAVPLAISDALNAAAAAAERAEAQNTRLLAAYDKVLREKVELNAILAAMHSDYNPNFNDPAVKAALRSWEDLASSNENDSSALGDLQPESLKQLVQTIEQTVEQELEEISNPVEAGSPSLWQDISQTVRKMLEDIGFLPRNPQSSSGQQGKGQAPKVRKAEEALVSAERAVSEVEGALNQVSQELKSSFGPDDVLRALKSECIVTTFGEYEYTVCWDGQITQRGNGQNTSLGKFDHADFPSAEQLSENSDEAFTMFFEDGARCWNGPIRRSIVRIECGPEVQLMSVAEAEKCIYEITLRSPAACVPEPREAALEQPVAHDEL